MDEPTFREIVTTHLLPLLGAELLPTAGRASSRESVVSYLDPCRLKLRPKRSSPFKLTMLRSQDFSSSERKLVGQFVDELATIAGFAGTPYMSVVLQAMPRRLIVRHLEAPSVMETILEKMELWASQTYEGQRVTSAIGITRENGRSVVSMENFFREAYAPVLSDGIDTIVLCGADGRLTSLSPLGSCAASREAPYRFHRIAGWATQGQVGTVLSRQGEILVFADGVLRFARRRGQWMHYVHETVVRRLWPPNDPALRQAIYESCLDVSFARTGGCLGVALNPQSRKLSEILSAADDLRSPSSTKSRVIMSALGAPFQRLDRRVRQELLALDGAVILDHAGDVRSVGAILQVPGGSDGGGRLAAARQLGRLGVGVKISADGPISGFRGAKSIFQVS